MSISSGKLGKWCIDENSNFSLILVANFKIMNKEFLQNSIVKEMRIIKRLSTKLPNDMVNYQPHQNVRTAIDLLQYLSICGTSMLGFWLDNHGLDFRAYFDTVRQKAASVTKENFVEKMDAEIALVENYFAGISEDDLHNKMVTLPAGNQEPLGVALLESSLKWLTAYKMQLFLYIKISTGAELKTPDLWRLTEIEVA